MKHKTFTYIAFVLLLGLSSCKQDVTPAIGIEGTPMTFRATGLTYPEVRTRATVDGDWEDVGTVAVMIGGKVKKYTASKEADDTSTILTSDDPFYWTGAAPQTVSAWWPYSDGQTEIPSVQVQADQSAGGFAQSDLIVAESQEVAIGATTLNFAHRTARITVTLHAGNVEGNIEDATVKFIGLSSDNGNPESITPYQSDKVTYEALVAPQTIAQGTSFISVELNGGTYNYSPNETDLVLAAGTRYIYALRLNANGLQLVNCTITDWESLENEEVDSDFSHANTGNIYLVSTAEELYAWADAVQAGETNANCILINDIVLPATENPEGNWTPVGNEAAPYVGTFDGNNYTISGMTISRSGQDFVGFFGYIGSGGGVKNLNLTGVDVLGRGQVGSVAGGCMNGYISACSSSGKVEGEQGNVGGVVGTGMGDFISCNWTGDVITASSYVGGVMGSLAKGSITLCTSAGTVSGSEQIGGIVGSGSGVITASHSSAAIVGAKTAVGGVVGNNAGGTLITACYSTGSVSGTSEVGGVVGVNAQGLISACYSTGEVEGTSNVGGVVGSNASGSITACYWSGALGLGVGQGAGEVSKVDDTITWEAATTAMNTALSAANSEWNYVQDESEKTIPPTLQKK